MVFIDKELDYTCIEILDSDKIYKFFSIDKSIFYDKNSLKNKGIMILKCPENNLSVDAGKILDIRNNIIEHNASTDSSSSGSPLINKINKKLMDGEKIPRVSQRIYA